MSTKKPSFALEIQPVNGNYKEGFKAVAKIGAGDFTELVLRYRLDGDQFNFKAFDSDGASTTCTASAKEVKLLDGKKPKFYAVASFAAGGKEESNEVEVDLS
ncbi:hypothetical protein ACYZUC_07305 [Pseudomonas sp. GT1P32]